MLPNQHTWKLLVHAIKVVWAFPLWVILGIPTLGNQSKNLDFEKSLDLNQQSTFWQRSLKSEEICNWKRVKWKLIRQTNCWIKMDDAKGRRLCKRSRKCPRAWFFPILISITKPSCCAWKRSVKKLLEVDVYFVTTRRRRQRRLEKKLTEQKKSIFRLRDPPRL